MWLGEKITDKGIGNGISMLIMIGIISRFPGALIEETISKNLNGLIVFILELGALFAVVMGTVLLTQAVRRIPVQYAKQVVGRTAVSKKNLTGTRSFIPIKVNAAGVMPIIFAQALMFVPSMVASLFVESSDFAASIATSFGDFKSWQYNLTFAVLIILFNFFYTAITINPNQIADDMKRSGGFIPGVKPGEETSEYIGGIVDRITLPGAIFLAIVAIMPAFASILKVGDQFAQFFGGTSLLIMVGVTIDTLQQIQTYLLMQKYEGLMETGDVVGENIPVGDSAI
jgi:preprotein translocase subunit SecY